MEARPKDSAFSPSESAGLAPDSVLALRYRVVRSLGDGAMANVWLVTDNVTGESLALKLLSPDASGHAEVLRTEFERLSRVDHENVVRVHDFGALEDGRPY